jgi:hypothetical protein
VITGSQTLHSRTKRLPNAAVDRQAAPPKAQYMARGSNMLMLHDLMETDDDL